MEEYMAAEILKSARKNGDTGTDWISSFSADQFKVTAACESNIRRHNLI